MAQQNTTRTCPSCGESHTGNTALCSRCLEPLASLADSSELLPSPAQSPDSNLSPVRAAAPPHPLMLIVTWAVCTPISVVFFIVSWFIARPLLQPHPEGFDPTPLFVLPFTLPIALYPAWLTLQKTRTYLHPRPPPAP